MNYLYFDAIAAVVVCFGDGLWNNPPNNLSKVPRKEKALAFCKKGTTIIVMTLATTIIVTTKIIISAMLLNILFLIQNLIIENILKKIASLRL